MLFRSKGLQIETREGSLKIVNDGKVKKFVNAVEQITFSGEYAIGTGQKVLYITERAVFQLTESGVELIEIAPGVDLEKDILSQMEFAPICNTPKLMDASIFTN